MRRDRERVRREVEAELEFHVEGVVEELVAAGWSPAAARAEAMRRFGDLSRIEAECTAIGRQRERTKRRLSMLRQVGSDIRHGVRVLRRNPGFATLAVLTLALGIGSTTAIFTVIDSVLLRPLQLPEPERLVLIWERNVAQGIERDRPSPPNFVDWQAASTTFEGMTAIRDASMTLTGVDRPEVVVVADVTANFFDVLGVPPMLGRGFDAGDDVSRARRIVLSHGAWQRWFGGDPGAIGRSLVLDGDPYEVIGVAPPAFRLPRAEVALWVPFDPTPEHRQSRYLTVVGRLARGVTMAQAEQEMRGIAARLAEQYPEANQGFEPYLVGLRDQLVGNARTLLLIVFGAVGFVLLLACTNAASLVLSRATARDGEIAVRSAMGATTRRLRAQLVTENMLIGVLAGVLGTAIAYWSVRAFIGWAPDAVPRGDEVTVDLRVLGFALLTSLLAGVVLGLVPAARATRAGVADLLREGSHRGAGSRRRELSRRVLIVAEVTLALVLLVGAGLSVRSLEQLRAVDPGFETERILAARVNLSGPRYMDGPPSVTNPRIAAYFDELLANVRAIPGVAAAAITSTLPLAPAGIDFDLPYHAEGHPRIPEGQAQQVDYRIISPGYLETMGMRLVRGRDFNDFDRYQTKQVMLVNESFAARHWPGEDPIGKAVTLFYVQETPWEVVGVVSDTRHQGLTVEPESQVFVPMAQAQLLFGYMTLVVRTQGSAAGLVERLQDAAIAIDASEPLYDFETVETLLADATARDRLAALVFGVFAVLALVLSAAGIYGVVSYQIARRTREIGVRMALGASRGRVLLGVLTEVLALAGAGIVLGAGLAAAGTRVAAGMLYGISTHDPVTYAAVSALLLTVAAVAALVPAVRAATIPPVHALRSD